MTEPYHSFIKRAPSGDDSLDNLCAQCDKSPMDVVHNPVGQCSRCKRLLSGSDHLIFETRGNQMICHLCKRVFNVKTVFPAQDELAEGKP